MYADRICSCYYSKTQKGKNRFKIYNVFVSTYHKYKKRAETQKHFSATYQTLGSATSGSRGGGGAPVL